MKELLLLLLCGIAVAVPACPYYTYKDYVEASKYIQPSKPADTILQYCNFNFDPICILANAFNTTEDKKLFIAEAIGNNSYENIFQWNQKIPFGKWFNVTKSSKNIKDAWVSLAYFSPSVYDNGTYLLNSTSKVFIKENFTFVVDTRKLGGDCNDNFRICGYDYSVSTKNISSNLTATLNVKSEYLVDRYHLVTHCDMTGCWVTCDYYRTDSFKDSISVSDSKKIKYENFTPDSNYSVAAYYNGLAEVLVNANNSKVYFQIGNSTFDKTNYTYKTRYELEPYNVLIKEIVPLNKTSEYGLSILERNNSAFRILVPYSPNCSLTISGHFNSKTISGCNLSDVGNSTKSEKVEIKQPAFFDSLLSLAELGIAFYILYQIGKKVMPHA
ncbi:hypothetical protein HY988_04610 [Candidatus Micrarchaeota archaeon]|nr:hypothetical protein [Candidatus Micrarchaeota archaeon]